MNKLSSGGSEVGGARTGVSGFRGVLVRLHKFLLFKGTRDYSSLLTLTDALAFRRSIGENAIIKWNSDLKIFAENYLSKAWKTEILDQRPNASVSWRMRSDENLFANVKHFQMLFCRAIKLPSRFWHVSPFEKYHLVIKNKKLSTNAVLLKWLYSSITFNCKKVAISFWNSADWLTQRSTPMPPLSL